MANGFGSLWVGAGALQTSQNALNVTANNLTNVNSQGYVRQQVVFQDNYYRTISTTPAISDSQLGYGVSIGEVIHARDNFLDKAYRTESGRAAFYTASYDAVGEVETYLQESDGEEFKDAIKDLYVAFAEFAKDPADEVNQNLVLQKSSLFVSRSQAVYNGLKDYQTIINTKIRNNIDRINEIGESISDLNKKIQQIESAGVETAMSLRDERDELIDELAGLVNIEYKEQYNGIVKISVEGVEFLDEVNLHKIQCNEDLSTGFLTPYWPQLSDKKNEDYFNVFKMDNISAALNTDIGAVKALLLARGDHIANYMDIDGLSEKQYAGGVANSVMMNSEAELDLLVHTLTTGINDLLSPLTSLGDVYGAGTTATYVNDKGEIVPLGETVRIADIKNCSVGSDGKIPPAELFSRVGCERYKEVTATITDGAGNVKTETIYLYNEENPKDTSTCYTLKSLKINPDVVQEESLIAHMTQTGEVAYDLSARLEKLWDEQNYSINPMDKTPCSFSDFYTKWIGELATTGSVYSTTSSSLKSTSEQIDASRQGVIGVSSDEELTNMIKYQNAYNAASRYINVVNEMIEHLITQLG